MRERRKAARAGGAANPCRGHARNAEMPIAAERPGGMSYGAGSIVPDEIERELEAAYTEVFNGGTFLGEGSDWDWEGTVTLTKLEPLLSAGSSGISSAGPLHGSGSSRNHPNPFTSTTALRFSLPRASSIGLVVYEDTALFAGLLKP